MTIQSKSFLIPLLKGKTDLIRIPKELADDLDFQGSITALVILPNNHKLNVCINVDDRTIIGLAPWLKTVDDDRIRSIRLKILDRNPYTFEVDFSEKAADIVESSEESGINRPEAGLYIGRKLLSQFYELIRTNESVSINEDDLLQHVFICGSTGYGKTVLAKAIIEEAARKRTPVIAIDLKGDISSMAMQVSGEKPSELIPWVVAQKGQSKESKAASIAEKQKAKLDSWGLSFKDVDGFAERVAVNVFTPRSDAGFRLALSAFVHRPEDLEALRNSDPDSFENAIQFMAETFVSRLTLSKKQADKAIGYVVEIVKFFWDQGTNLRGYDGVQRILDEVAYGEVGIEQIGGKVTDEYISTQDRKHISDSINTLLIGAQKLWFKGFPLEIEQLISSNNYDDRTPVSIINLKHLGFQDQAYVVGYIAYLIWFWMQNLEGVDEPRLIFYIDEIAGGGGKQAFFPSVAMSPSKPALNLLLKQGRGYGVCCMFATQSPGDIDYKALGQCSTWIVGRLLRKRERNKIEEAASTADLNFEQVSEHIQTLDKGQFVITTPSLPWTILEERWLMHPIHRILSQKDLERLKENYEKQVLDLFEQADKSTNEGKPSVAKDILKLIINGFKFSSLCARAYLRLGKVLYDMSDYEKAIETLNELITNRMEAEEIGEAYFLLGKCREQLEQFTDAARDFAKAVSSGASEETKESASGHHEYCSSRATWSELTEVVKFFWWITGRKPDSSVLVRLQVRDKDLLEREFKSILSEQHFSVPEPINYKKLLEAEKEAAKAHLEENTTQKSAKNWVKQQIPQIEEYLLEEDYDNTFLLCRKAIICLRQSGAVAPDRFKSIVKKYNHISTSKSQKLRNKLRRLEAIQFEFEIANLFRKKGYESWVTQVTGDDGVDVFAKRDSEKTIIQCKRWRHPVGRDKVDELAGVCNRYAANRAILVTTSEFSEGAKKAAHKNSIELWDFYRLKREWQSIYAQE